MLASGLYALAKVAAMIAYYAVARSIWKSMDAVRPCNYYYNYYVHMICHLKF
jgi:hypothetical protein